MYKGLRDKGMKKYIKYLAIGLIIFSVVYGFIDKQQEKRKIAQYPASNYSNPKGNNQVKTIPPANIPKNSTSNTVPSTPKKKSICIICGGSRACKICNGRGIYSNYGFKGPCTVCDDRVDSVDADGIRRGNGKCSACHGTGFN